MPWSFSQEILLWILCPIFIGSPYGSIIRWPILSFDWWDCMTTNRCEPRNLAISRRHTEQSNDISLQDQRPRNIDPEVQVWHRCRNEHNTIFHCKESLTKNAKRLNHLVHISQTVDQNAYFREGTNVNKYDGGRFLQLHQILLFPLFEEKPYMLMYSKYQHVREINGLVRNDGQ